MAQRWTNEIQAKVIARAWKDDNFRKLLTSNPQKALKEFGIELPNTMEMKVCQEDQNHLYFVLPNSPSEANTLSEKELEKLAAAGKILGCCSIPDQTI